MVVRQVRHPHAGCRNSRRGCHEGCIGHRTAGQRDAGARQRAQPNCASGREDPKNVTPAQGVPLGSGGNAAILGSLAHEQTSVSANTYIGRQYVLGDNHGQRSGGASRPTEFDPPSVEINFALIPPLEAVDVSKARDFRTFDADMPPEVTVWVGRDDELHKATTSIARVIAITGIGGQGKSALAAKALQQWRDDNPDSFWDWRDCREAGDRFPVQLAAVISRLTLGQIDAADIAKASIENLSKLFFRLTRNASGIIVFDNVDHYVNVEDRVLGGSFGVFIQEALRSPSRFTILVTCRPSLVYPNVDFFTIPLKGLSQQEAIGLFRQREVSVAEATDQQICSLTDLTQGHPFWLTLVAVEIHVKHAQAEELTTQIAQGLAEHEPLVAMLRPVWKLMSDRERWLMLLLNECRKPLTQPQICEMIRSKITSNNQVRRGLNAVVSYGLVTKKSQNGQDSAFELHPVVRQYLRQDAADGEQQTFNALVESETRPYLAKIKAQSASTLLEFDVFEFAGVHIETLIGNHDVPKAAEAAVIASDAFVAIGLLREHLRLCDEILKQINWTELRNQDSVLHRFISQLIRRYAEVGNEASARKLISEYEPWVGTTTPVKIEWRSLLCQVEWLFGRLDAAVEHGRAGLGLKSVSDIDTISDAASTLYLALRDMGEVDEALKFYLAGETVEQILAGGVHKDKRSESNYGNIGRCLFMLKDYDRALQFYARSWQLLRKGVTAVTVENRGWAGFWIGESLIAREAYREAAFFLTYAREVWSQRLPLRLPAVERLLHSIPADATIPHTLSAADIKTKCDVMIGDIINKAEWLNFRD